jgi:hypothetical protein
MQFAGQYTRYLTFVITRTWNRFVGFDVLCGLKAVQGPRGQLAAVYPLHALGKKLTSVHPAQTPHPP